MHLLYRGTTVLFSLSAQEIKKERFYHPQKYMTRGSKKNKTDLCMIFLDWAVQVAAETIHIRTRLKNVTKKTRYLKIVQNAHLVKILSFSQTLDPKIAHQKEVFD
jgi:hypothetical protein